ncbi:MAG TPA: MarR family transcriptional regulator [Rhodanobacteraceae bacterium]|nr:MarR family transcriptional regulator [Rhodanobacteraceae bacterium]
MKIVEERPLCDALNAMRDGIRSMGTRIDNFSTDDVVLLRTLLMVAPVLLAGFDQEVRRMSALGETEFRTLCILFSQEDGSATPSELCSCDTHGRANMTRIGDVLVAQGLVTRSTAVEDRRRVVLRITAKGRKLVENLVPRLRPGLSAVLGNISATRKRQLADTLRVIAANIDHWSQQSR